MTPGSSHPRAVVPVTPRGSTRWKAWLVNAIFPIALFAISFGINNDTVTSTEIHPDETRWLNRAYYLEEFIHPYGETWQDYYLTRGQPPGGSYLMGLGLWLQGKPLDSNGVWDFHYGTDWNELAGAVPADDVLYAGRRTNAVVGALVVALAYFVASKLSNPVGGVVAGLFLAFHPLHIMLSTQALSDELLALSLGVSFAAAWKYAHRPGYGWALVMGVALGIGGATKLAPLALSFALAGYGLVWLLWQARQRGILALWWPSSRFALYLLLQPVIAGFTFVALYPYLWVNPIRRSLNLLEFRRDEMASQARIWWWAKVNNPKEAFQRYGEQLHDAASSTRHYQQWLADSLGLDVSRPVSFDFILVAIGAILLMRIVIQRGLWSPEAMVAMLMAAELGAVTVGLGVDFYRYYLPILLVNSILVGIACGEAVNAVGRFVAPHRVGVDQPASTSALGWDVRQEGAS